MLGGEGTRQDRVRTFVSPRTSLPREVPYYLSGCAPALYATLRDVDASFSVSADVPSYALSLADDVARRLYLDRWYDLGMLGISSADVVDFMAEILHEVTLSPGDETERHTPRTDPDYEAYVSKLPPSAPGSSPTDQAAEHDRLRAILREVADRSLRCALKTAPRARGES